MKWTILAQHRRFFALNKYIEFDEVLSTNDVDTLKTEIEKELCKRLNTTNLYEKSSDRIFSHGNDLWTTSNFFRNFVRKNAFSSLCASLRDKTEVRLGFDQVLISTEKPPTDVLFSQSLTLENLSCIHPLTCGVFIPISLKKGDPIFSSTIGSATFIHPKKVFSLESFYSTPHQMGYLIVFSSPEAKFTVKDNLSHTTSLKKMGYGSGDNIGNKTHPILLR